MIVYVLLVVFFWVSARAAMPSWMLICDTEQWKGLQAAKLNEKIEKMFRGKRAFIAGVADDNGYGWPIAKAIAASRAEILVGTWVPTLNIFETSLRHGKFDESR
ncbi:hypothetical protein ABZP36_009628 [Zizania latifolia]